MWEIYILLGVAAIILYFVVYSYYSQNIKGEKDFAQDVFHYLIRRYPSTKVVDWGGLSSDPLIESRNAGPFRTLEIRVTTEKHNGTIDRDLILRGMIDIGKYRIERKDVSNVLISPRITWNDPKTKVKLGSHALDQRLNVNAYNSVFVRDLVIKTDLGDLLGKNYDLEAFSLHWYKSGDLAIQIRMESMNSSSFLSAFNMALASVGILIQKGYLNRIGKDQKEPVSKRYVQQEKIYANIPQQPSYKAPELPKISVDTERHQKKPAERQEQKSKTYYAPPATSIHKKELSEENPLIPLFTAIRYQVKDITFEETRAIISTFSSQVPQVIVSFSNVGRAKLLGVSSEKSKSPFKISMNNAHEPQAPTWDKPWNKIELNGEKAILDQIKFRTAIANRINEIGNIRIDITGSNDGVSYSIMVNESKPAITAGYSLLIDLVWFFEML